MSNEQGKGGSPTDDRTILDPLNAEELKALREARERFQKNAKGGGAIGPDTGDDLGDAPTRSVGSLPSFDKPGPALASLGSSKIMPDPKPLTPQGARIAAPPAVAGAPPPSGGIVQIPGAAPMQGPPQPQQGFGENTLMWMAPVKVEQPQIIPERGAAAASGMIPTIVPPETKSRRLMRYGIAAVMGVVIALAAGWFFFGGGKPGSIELTTNPPKAEVWIDGKLQSEVRTPMKATLAPGQHTIQFKLPNFQEETFVVEMAEGSKLPLKHIEMTPISDPGKMTVSIEVQPVAANIMVNADTFNGKKVVKVANLDPNKANKITIEAGGYAKIENEIPAGALKGSYNFILQPN